MTENYLLKGAKMRMIERLRAKGITDELVLRAFEKVDRHRFIDSVMWDKAYDDTALKLINGQTISHPYTVAFQSQLLEIKKGEKVLEIGTGSGFQAAILSAMGARVYSIERQRELFLSTTQLLEEIDHRIFTYYGDGYAGLPKFAPFSKIIVTCGAPYIPQALVEQLAPKGIMVIPVGEETQIMKRIIKDEQGGCTEEDFGNFLFVPMLENRTTK